MIPDRHRKPQNPISEPKTMQIRFLGKSKKTRAEKSSRFIRSILRELEYGSKFFKTTWNENLCIFVTQWIFGISCQSLRAQFLNACCLVLDACCLMPDACLLLAAWCLNTCQTHPQRIPQRGGGRRPPPLCGGGRRPPPFVDGSGRCSSIKQQAASKHQASSSKHQAPSSKH